MNYTKEQLKLAKEILLNLISSDREIIEEYFGICWNGFYHPMNKYDEELDEGLVNIYIIVNEFSVGWEHHSGKKSYPVPDIRGNKWEGKNLELRIDLMKYIIGKIDEMLEGM